jgi:photosystem II stability/assembly factor-like uncharacterized protein
MFNAKLFLSASRPGIARAELVDDGSWRVETVLDGFDVRCLARDPHDGDTVYAGTQGNGVLRSIDRGLTWYAAGLEGQIVKSLAISKVQPGMLVAGTKPPLVYRSDDGGETWNEMVGFRRIPSRPLWRSPAEPPGTAYVQSIALSPTDPNVIVAGIEFGAVVRSSDGGQTWTGHREGALRDCHNLVFHASDSRYTYEAGGTGAGAAISRTAGETWNQPRNGMDRHYGWAVAADPGDATIWYVSSAAGPRRAHSEQPIADAGIFRSAQGGAWEKLSGGLPDPLGYMPYALLTDPNAPGHLYAGLRSGEVWFSENYGDAWLTLGVQLPRIDGALVMLE